MPIYEYSCPACGNVFEEWLSSSSDENQPCPQCGTSSPRLLSNTSFILKGGGWFASSYGHGTSNLFDKSKGVPSLSDSKPAEDSASSGSSAPKADAPAAPAAPAASAAPSAPAKS